MDNCVSIFSIPYELLSFIIHPSKYPLINEEMRQFKNEEITISLKKNLEKQHWIRCLLQMIQKYIFPNI